MITQQQNYKLHELIQNVRSVTALRIEVAYGHSNYSFEEVSQKFYDAVTELGNFVNSLTEEPS